MDRKEYEKGLICLMQWDAFGKPDLNRVEAGDHTFMVKDVRRKNLFFRWTLGLWLIHKEWKIYSRLVGIKGIPKAVERIDRFAFAMEFVPGRPINRGEAIPSSFFSDLERLLRQVHSRGVVHLDLRWVDYGGLLKLKQRTSPSSMTPEEVNFLKRFNRLRKLWIFN